MFPFDLFRSEASASNLLQQVRWRDGLQRPRCRSDSVIKSGSYRAYQRYRCKDCGRTFNDKTGISKRGRGSYNEDKPPVFILVDRSSDQRYVVPSKSTDESTVRLFLDNHEEEPLTVYTDGFRVYDPLDDDENFQREAVIHGEGEYVDGDIHVNTCESHASLA